MGEYPIKCHLTLYLNITVTALNQFVNKSLYSVVNDDVPLLPGQTSGFFVYSGFCMFRLENGRTTHII